jgi:hypothetical protein
VRIKIDEVELLTDKLVIGQAVDRGFFLEVRLDNGRTISCPPGSELVIQFLETDTPRKYTVVEMDSMRNDVRKIMEWEHTDRGESAVESSGEIDSRLHSYMAAGIDPTELRKRRTDIELRGWAKADYGNIGVVGTDDAIETPFGNVSVTCPKEGADTVTGPPEAVAWFNSVMREGIFPT